MIERRRIYTTGHFSRLLSSHIILFVNAFFRRQTATTTTTATTLILLLLLLLQLLLYATSPTTRRTRHAKVHGGPRRRFDASKMRLGWADIHKSGSFNIIYRIILTH